ncbi:MAG: type I restriction enzyme HsdR N-terminal domain-containing protein [Desulfoprunum sp.]|nr:type I restriction enzyme HsdR N-terminal domain-containing protein [Desulfoprunum sp.]
MTEHLHHHLIYGTLFDYLTHEELTDTDDERLRQALSRMMVEEKLYQKAQLQPRLYIETFFSRCFVRSVIELTVSLGGRQFMIIRYGPGSLVSRERAAVAAGRVLNPAYRIPLAVVTNGEDAELLDTSTGKILGYGLDSIPDRSAAENILPDLEFLPPLEGAKRERELRILNAFDVERCCV